MKQPSPVVLIYHAEAEQLLKLASVCMLVGVELKRMDEDTQAVPLGLAAGALDWKNPLLAGTHGVDQVGPLTQPLLVMAGFDETLLDRFLGLMRAEKLQIPMKAVLTENNANWNAMQLAAHIVLEIQSRRP